MKFMDKEKPIYEDTFLTIGTWLNSGTVKLIAGMAVSILLGVNFHWMAGLAIFVIVGIYSIASFIIIRK
jgi:hypothetical protein